jgi:DNA-binding HxlR family transcriptional regulator
MVRAGAHALSLLSVPLNVEVLTALQDEPTPLVDLRKAAGSPPPTTMRGHVRTLTKLGVVERFRHNQFPGNTDLALGAAGRDLLTVARAVEDWLAIAPDGPIEPGTPAAKSSIKALVEGWSNNVVRAIAARPLSLTELDGVIPSLSYPSLERRLVAMRDVGLIAARPSNGRGTPYAATTWLRRAITPLAAAAHWERRRIPTASPPISRLDIEAAFLLAVPMLTLASQLSGTCRLAVDMPRDREHDFVGILFDVQDGEVLSCSSRLAGAADVVVTGSSRAWLRAVIDREPGCLARSGDRELAAEVVDGLHGALFRSTQMR